MVSWVDIYQNVDISDEHASKVGEWYVSLDSDGARACVVVYLSAAAADVWLSYTVCVGGCVCQPGRPKSKVFNDPRNSWSIEREGNGQGIERVNEWTTRGRGEGELGLHAPHKRGDRNLARFPF